MLNSASKALEIILNEVKSLPSEEVSLLQAKNRYLASSIKAPISLPPFNASAMDGFALHASETNHASNSHPMAFKVIDTLAAGDCFNQNIQKGQCLRIMTGAALPSFCNAVIPFEDAKEENGKCWVYEKVSEFKHVRKKGEDVLEGSFILNVGQKLTIQNLPLLAALGFSQVPVTQQPSVSLFSTGNELQSLGLELKPGQIYDSNMPSLCLVLENLGLKAQVVNTPKDTIEDLENSFQQALKSQVILTVGAVSAGDFDLIPQVLKKIGAKIYFHKLAIKPGKPLLFARWGDRFIFCLPGNPVSALVVFDRFVRPALLKMMGATVIERPRYFATVLEELKATPGKEDYLRGFIEWREGNFFAKLSGGQGSAQLLSFAQSNALLIIPENISKVSVGEKVEFEFWSFE